MRGAVAYAIFLGILFSGMVPLGLAFETESTQGSSAHIVSIETVASDSGPKRALSIDEHSVTWTYSNAKPPGHPADGRAWDRVSHTTLNITAPGERLGRHIACGDAIVWSNWLNNSAESLFGYDIGRQEHFNVSLPRPGWLFPVACEGGTGIGVWGNQSPQYDLLIFRLSTAEFRVLELPGNQSWPDIWGDTIVWLDDRLERSTAPLGAKGSLDVYSLNLTTGVEQRLTNDTSQPGPPQVWNGFVVWADLRGKDPEYSRTGEQTTSVDPSFDPDLMAHDLSTDRPWIAASGAEIDLDPGDVAFGGGVVVWNRFGWSTDPLVILDLQSGREWDLVTGVVPLSSHLTIWNNTLA